MNGCIVKANGNYGPDPLIDRSVQVDPPSGKGIRWRDVRRWVQLEIRVGIWERGDLIVATGLYGDYGVTYAILVTALKSLAQDKYLKLIQGKGFLVLLTQASATGRRRPLSGDPAGVPAAEGVRVQRAEPGLRGYRRPPHRTRTPLTRPPSWFPRDRMIRVRGVLQPDGQVIRDMKRIARLA